MMESSLCFIPISSFFSHAHFRCSILSFHRKTVSVSQTTIANFLQTMPLFRRKANENGHIYICGYVEISNWLACAISSSITVSKQTLTSTLDENNREQNVSVCLFKPALFPLSIANVFTVLFLSPLMFLVQKNVVFFLCRHFHYSFFLLSTFCAAQLHSNNLQTIFIPYIPLHLVNINVYVLLFSVTILHFITH